MYELYINIKNNIDKDVRRKKLRIPVTQFTCLLLVRWTLAELKNIRYSSSLANYLHTNLL